MRKILLFTVLTIVCVNAIGQAPSITWQKCLGSSGNDEGTKIYATSDGGSIMIGHVSFTDGDVSGGINTIYPSGSNIWVCKLSSTGTIQWKNMLGSAGDDYGYSIKQTTDGGYILCGTISGGNSGYPFDTDVSQPSKGGIDCWVVKLNSNGTKAWEKNYGGSSTDQALDIIQTADGGFAFTGWTNSNNGDVSGNPGNSSYWAVKLNSTGAITWQKCYGGTLGDFGQSIIQTIDGGYAIAGYTLSVNGDITASKGGGYDYWIVKANSTGTLEWQKSLGGTMDDRAYSIAEYADGNLLILGTSKSANGDKTDFKIAGNNDTWVVKLTGLGTILWNKAFGSASNEGRQVAITSDGGFISVSDVGANGYDVTGKHGSSGTDMWVAKANAAGNLQWQLSLGGTEIEYAQSIMQAADGSYYVCGITRSNDGDVSGKHTSSIITTDAWVVKLAAQSLPLNFINLWLNNTNNGVNISWQTVNENQVSHFEIQHSLNGRSYIAIGTQKAKNTTLNNYVFTDTGFVTGRLTYYRVMSVDVNGDRYYSPVRTIFPFVHSSRISIYPNPAQSSVTIESYTHIKELQLILQSGQLVMRCKPNSSKQVINTAHLSKGLYTLVIETESGAVLFRKFLLQ